MACLQSLDQSYLGYIRLVSCQSSYRQAAIKILSDKVYAGFGPTLAAEYLADKHDIRAGRETVRGWMVEGGGPRDNGSRRSTSGVSGGRAQARTRLAGGSRPEAYLTIDDATSRIHARFVLHDSIEENMRLLWSYLEGHGRPLSFYTDKQSLFQTAPKTIRDTIFCTDFGILASANPAAGGLLGIPRFALAVVSHTVSRGGRLIKRADGRPGQQKRGTQRDRELFHIAILSVFSTGVPKQR